MFAEPVVLRGLAAAAAASAVVGSVVMRGWDRAAGKRVAELSRARASDEWRYEERIAECESDLEEARELRSKLENKLRAKRAELAALRNEHAALLRRYATAETERASALEGRRLLAIETTEPTRALPPGESSSAAEVAGAGTGTGTDLAPSLFEQALAALDRFERGVADVDVVDAEDAVGDGAGGADAEGRVEAEADADAADAADAADVADVAVGVTDQADVDGVDGVDDVAPDADVRNADVRDAVDDEPQGEPEAADGHERALAGHFTVPAAAAVVPPAQVRRPATEGGFDFFGTKSAAPAALDAVQNEDLADVVGEEALAVHKAEAEAEFKPSDAATDAERGVGQVIDLTAHDETEQIDVEGLRTALQA
ncbi:hypothetical protein [Streptomyces sp. NPDC059063]|uniref:hypothetical protein n=1 Tax=unclassified Streptomyces TaxID=2593676 RepID=UPI0036CEE2B0